MARNERMIAALLRERDGLARQGKTDRVALVDEQLQFYGYEPAEKPAEEPAGEKPAEAPVEKVDPKKQAPQGRSAKPQQQTKD